MHRGGGSIGIIGAARAGFMVGRDPENDEEMIFACIKMNLAREPTSLAYTTVTSGDTSRIEWSGESDVSASDLVAKPGGKSAPKLQQAKEIISDILADGPRGENEVKTACTKEDVSYRTYHRERKELNVQSEKTSFRGEWLLSMTGGQECQDL